MKKLLAFSLFTVTTAAIALVVACDTGSNITECTSQADCAGGEGCDLSSDPGVCTPETCADGTDCDLANPDSPTSQEDCENDEDCVNADSGDTCVTDGVGVTYCAVAEDAAGGADCDTIQSGSEGVEVDGATICLVTGAECSEGVCAE